MTEGQICSELHYLSVRSVQPVCHAEKSELAHPASTALRLLPGRGRHLPRRPVLRNLPLLRLLALEELILFLLFTVLGLLAG